MIREPFTWAERRGQSGRGFPVFNIQIVGPGRVVPIN